MALYKALLAPLALSWMKSARASRASSTVASRLAACPCLDRPHGVRSCARRLRSRFHPAVRLSRYRADLMHLPTTDPEQHTATASRWTRNQLRKHRPQMGASVPDGLGEAGCPECQDQVAWHRDALGVKGLIIWCCLHYQPPRSTIAEAALWLIWTLPSSGRTAMPSRACAP